jgi:hypothetical protein
MLKQIKTELQKYRTDIAAIHEINKMEEKWHVGYRELLLTYSGNESNTLVTQNCALLSYHAVCSGSILPTF